MIKENFWKKLKKVYAHHIFHKYFTTKKLLIEHLDLS